MNILVTGATGFVGSHVARLLAERGDCVRALIRRTSRTDNLASLDVEPYYGDLQQPDTLRPAMEGCELVYHIAADYRLWSRDSAELYRNNVDGTRNVLEAAKNAGVHKVVY